MNKTYISLIFFMFSGLYLFAGQTNIADSINLPEVNVYGSKETNLKNAPVSSTILDEEMIIRSQITTIRDLSGKIPNFFIPDYGSALSGAPYVRGVGSRNSSQSVSLNVDNVPYLEKSAFDFQLYDIARIEVLRGPQGTLYGRNAMSGIMNIYTISPLNYQGIKADISAGNYGYMNGKLSLYTKFNDKWGLTVGGYYGQHNGYYLNDFTGKNVDAEKSTGVRAKLVWDASKQFKMDYIADFDYVSQGAFPYGLYDESTQTTANPNFNEESNYFRRRLNNALSAKYIYQDVIITASLSHQYFEDEMNMDQDYSPLAIYSIKQTQKQNMFNGEVIVKSLSAGNYKWLVGVNGYGQKNDMFAPVTFHEDGLKMILQPIFTPLNIRIVSPVFYIPGWYDNTRSSGAMFHQSTFDNLITEGLSLTLGARLDVEDVKLDYDSRTSLDVELNRGPQVPPLEIKMATELVGSVDTTFVELLPKAALKYEWNNRNFMYASVSRGYKSGGFNVQMISDLLTQKFMNYRDPNAAEPDVKKGIMYKPEHSWNYELGFHNSFADNRIKTELTLFYMDISGLQLTEFVASGAGRMLTNAGSSVSKGVELSADMSICGGLSLILNYGYAHASFRHYTEITNVNGEEKEISYKGKIVPYAPQHTANASLNYMKNLNNSFVDRIYGTLAWSGIGKIYWTEENDVSEDFYSLLDAKIGAKKGIFSLELWGKNLLNTSYNVFYFETSGRPFYQKGKPLEFGARLALDI